MNPAHARAIRRQATEQAYLAVAASFRQMPLWRRLKLALFARWY